MTARFPSHAEEIGALLADEALRRAADAARTASYHDTADGIPVHDAHPLGRFPDLFSQAEMDRNGRWPPGWFILPGAALGAVLLAAWVLL